MLFFLRCKQRGIKPTLRNKSIQEEKNKVGQKMNVGIDVGKARLDLFLHEIKLCFSVENNPTGIRKAIKRLSQYRIDRIVIVNPLKIRRYAGAIGILAKTDPIDCRLIAQYAAVIQPEVRRQKMNYPAASDGVSSNLKQPKLIFAWFFFM